MGGSNSGTSMAQTSSSSIPSGLKTGDKLRRSTSTADNWKCRNQTKGSAQATQARTTHRLFRGDTRKARINVNADDTMMAGTPTTPSANPRNEWAMLVAGHRARSIAGFLSEFFIDAAAPPSHAFCAPNERAKTKRAPRALFDGSQSMMKLDLTRRRNLSALTPASATLIKAQSA
jgi:hypothetical protein